MGGLAENPNSDARGWLKSGRVDRRLTLSVRGDEAG